MPKRPDMLASVIREIIAPVLRECPQECGIVSIVRVEVSVDFSYASVYISALREPERALQFLDGRRKSLQHALGNLHRAKIPHLRFRIDRTSERAARIEELLNDPDL